MESFITEREIFAHKEYLGKLKEKYAAYEKIYPEIVGKGRKELFRIPGIRGRIDEILGLKNEIMLHEVYFSSFSAPKIGVTPYFLNALFLRAVKLPYGFVGIFEKSGKLEIFEVSDYKDMSISFSPTFALDMCEHAYFRDFGFSRDKYVESALKRAFPKV